MRALLQRVLGDTRIGYLIGFLDSERVNAYVSNCDGSDEYRIGYSSRRGY
jgi:hypothetical protein